MAITYNMGFNPIWYISDQVGRPLGGGYLAAYRQLNPQQVKLVYQDGTDAFPWALTPIPNTSGVLGILFDENGSQGPFFFQVDPANPDDTYFLTAYDSVGNLIWTVPNYVPATGSGGSVITSAVHLVNLITNGVMWRNKGVTPVSTTAYMTVAPGAHAGLTYTSTGLAGPDIIFSKNNLSATDTIAFPAFTTNALSPDVTPENYCEYVCSGAGSAETRKYFQFPITKGVQNLNNLSVSLTIWARANDAPKTMTLSWYQFYGDGVEIPSSLITTFASQAITSSWAKYTFTNITIPTVIGVTLGACRNDGLFLQVGMPLNSTCTIDFTKPCMYASTLVPSLEYQTNDMIDAVINAPRTGYVFPGFDLVAPYGYLLMDDGTIGQAGSGATSNSGRGANVNTFPLYNWLYTNVTLPSTNTWCAVTGYTGNAVTDFLAGRVMNLPRALGRVLGSSGTGAGLTARVIGSYLGEENHTMTLGELVSHVHAIDTYNNTTGAGAATVAHAAGGHAEFNSQPAGSSTPFNVMQPTTFMNWFIKL